MEPEGDRLPDLVGRPAFAAHFGVPPRCVELAHFKFTIWLFVRRVGGEVRPAPERFRAKACPALDAGWITVRVKKTRQNKRLELGSDSISRCGEIRSNGDREGTALPLPLAGEGWGGGAAAIHAVRVERISPTRIASFDAVRPPPQAGEVQQVRGQADSTKNHPALALDQGFVLDDDANAFFTTAENFAQLQVSERSSQRTDFDRSTCRFVAGFFGVNTIGGPAG
jgi:hypothetical protein